MGHKLLAGAALMLGLSPTGIQAAPSVAVDIAPLHSLVSQVMEGVGEPKLIIPAEASPHRYTLRPSEVRALANAKVVFWMGESYTPWLEKAMNNVASSAYKVEFLEMDDTLTHPFREGATFESHDHGDEKKHKDEKHHKHEHHKKDEHHHDKKHAKHSDDHKKDHHHKHHHDHEGDDPHAWLDPENAKRWLKNISDILSKQDPDNASTYSSNAAGAIASLDTLIESTRSKINGLSKPQFIVFHDAYQYFEKRFDVPAAGSIALGGAEDPSPARIKEIRETVKNLGVTCVFTEPQFNPGLVKNVFEGTEISTIGVIDPLGASLSTGSDHYQKLIQGIVTSLSQCQ